VTLNDRSEVFRAFNIPASVIYLLSGARHYRHGRHTYVLRGGQPDLSGDIAMAGSASRKSRSACIAHYLRQRED